ncbi:uncharacterized protein LOC129219848 [Uloborus diversus]|uniref:uncharacterized protein LOC129219848 n=1 Tax=Uloborus diversus TaxID=327109 RepID=UPI0024092456|nr:uncharacterized protein LOC129219848 [Uloborus diversus]
MADSGVVVQSLREEVVPVHHKMDCVSERSTAFPADDALTCCLEEEERWRWRKRFPPAEICVVGSTVGGMLLVAGGVMLTLHYTLEQEEGRTSVLEHMRIASDLLGLVLVAVAVTLFVGALLIRVLSRVLDVLEMAHRYRAHRELCAYEEMRQSFRSQQGLSRIDNSGRSTAVDATMGRYATPERKEKLVINTIA